MTIGDQEYTYYAFISYKREDEKWAKWLEKKLESFGFPVAVRKENPELPSKIYPVFRDQSDLTGGNLNQELEKALRESKFLIVVCSPRAARSPWVSKEVQWFIDHGRENCIIPYIIGGTPNAAEPADECFPEGLRQLTGEREILGVNVNDMGREAAMIKIVARMFGLRFDTLWQSQQRAARRRRRIIYAAVTLFALLCLAVGAIMFHQKNRIAEENWRMMENRARAVAEKANLLIDQGNSYLARILLLEVLPTDLEHPNRPYVPEAEAALRRAVKLDNAIIKHESDLRCLSISPDGQRIVTGSTDHKIRILNVETGECIDTLSGHESWVASVAFSPNGKLIVSGSSQDHSIRLWNVETGECIDTLSGHESWVTHVVFSPDGKLIASGSYDKTIRIWDVETGECIDTLSGHEDWVKSIAFSPDGRRIVSGCGNLCIWDVETKVNKSIYFDYRYMYNDVGEVAFSPDGKRLLSGHYDGTIYVWDANTFKCIDTLREHRLYVEAVIYSPDGNQIASAGGEGKLCIWDASTSECVEKLEFHRNEMNSIAYSADGRKLVCGGGTDNGILIRNIDNDVNTQPYIYYKKYNNPIKSVSFSHDGNLLAFNQGRSIIIQDFEHEIYLDTLSGHSDGVKSIVFSPDDKKIISGSDDESIRIWDIETGVCLDTLDEHQHSVRSLALNADGKRLVSGSLVGSVRLWDVEMGNCIDTLENGSGSVAISPDAKIIAYADGHNINLWDADRKLYNDTLFGHSSFVKIVVFSPDGKLIASGAHDHDIRIWDSENHKCKMVLKQHLRTITCLAFSPDSKRLVSASYDGTVKLWDTETGVCIDELVGLKSTIYSVAFHPRVNNIVIGTYDGTMVMWNFSPLQELIDETRERFKNRKLTPEERHKYYLD